MQQDGNQIDGSLVINAGGNVFVDGKDKLIMLLVITVMVISVLNVFFYCAVMFFVIVVPEAMPVTESWSNAP